MKAVTICAAAACVSLAWCSYGVAASTFLTGVEDAVANLDAQLYGFDEETEVFATQSGADSAFHGAVILNDIVLVADYRSESIRRFSLSGGLLSDFANITDPVFLEVDRTKNVYVTHNSLGPAVATRFDSTGNVTGTYIAPRVGYFNGIDSDALGNVYVVFQVSGSQNHEIQKFASDGTFLGSLPIDGNAFDMAIDEANGRLFLADSDAGAGVHVYDISGNLPVFDRSIAVSANTEAYGLHYSSELGTLFVSDFGELSGDPRGFQIDLDGNVLATYRPQGAELVFDITHRVPEPASLLLVIGGLLALAACKFRSGSAR